MALTTAAVWVVAALTLCTCLASPTRRQYIPLTETTSSDPVLTRDDHVWDDDTDDFDPDPDDDWMNQVNVSPSPFPDYEDYDDDDEYNVIQDDKDVLDFGSDNDDFDHQDAEEDTSESSNRDSEFLFLPSKDTRLLLQDDDDDDGGLIKVRHTGSYSRVLDADNSVDVSTEDKTNSNDPFVFSVDEDSNDDEDDDDFIVEDTSNKVVDNDEEEFIASDDDDDRMFDNPEEDSEQVIYGDHVFLY